MEPETPEGRAKGGIARARALSPERRREIALKGVAAKRERAAQRKELEKLPKATHGDPAHPLIIGNWEVPCYVLEDKRRVLVQRGVMDALDMSQGTAGRGAGDRIAKFVATKALTPFVSEELANVIKNPIIFQTTHGSRAYGYEATVLADICDSVLEARKQGKLHYQQVHIADRCEALVRAFAKVGIIALVDEATGFQYDRPRRDLEEQLKKFLSESLRRWVRTFPADYFKHLCRLRGVELRPDMKLPQYFGHLTNNLVYRRIAPGLLHQLKERRAERGSLSNKLNQWLSLDIGVPELLLHLGTVIAVMKQHTKYDDFERALEKVAQIYPETPGLFDDPKDWEPRV
jgi:hypothetical protein